MVGKSMRADAGIGFILSAGLAAVFLLPLSVLLYFTLTGPMPVYPALGVHMVGGAAVLAVAPFQFLAPVRNRWRRLHRGLGYVFLSGSAVAIAAYLALMPGRAGDIIWLSQFTAIVLWGVCATVAFVSIRKGRLLAHRHNMARAFVLAAYFVVVRLIDRFGMVALAPLASDETARFVHSDWLAWVVPLVLVEAYFANKWYRLLDRRAKSVAVP